MTLGGRRKGRRIHTIQRAALMSQEPWWSWVSRRSLVRFTPHHHQRQAAEEELEGRSRVRRHCQTYFITVTLAQSIPDGSKGLVHRKWRQGD